MQELLHAEIEADCGKLTSQSWKGDILDIKPSEGKELFASLNVNGRALVDHDKIGLSHWSILHELDIRAATIQDTRLSTPDKQSAAQRQARMFADGNCMTYSWSDAQHLGTAEGVGMMVKGSLVPRVMKRQQAHIIQDSRGWNRYAGVSMQGKKGIKLAMISLYIPCAHSTSWKAQQVILLTTYTGYTRPT